MTVEELRQALADVPGEYNVEIICEGMDDCTNVEVCSAYNTTECDYKYEQDGFWPRTDSPRMRNLGPILGTERKVFVQGRVVLS